MKLLRITPFLRGAPISPTHGGKSLTSWKITKAVLEEDFEIFILPWSKEDIHQEVKLKVSGTDQYVTGLRTTYIRQPKELSRQFFTSYFKKGTPMNPIQHVWEELRESVYDKHYFLQKAIDQVQPDIVHAHYTHSDIADHYRDLNIDIPFVLTHHSRGVSESIPLYDYVIFMSHFQKKEALEVYPEYEDKNTVIHTCVSPDYLRPITPQKNNQVLFLSSLKRGKGFTILLDAFSTQKELDKYKLSVIGDGDLLPEFKQTAEEHHANNIDFHGRVSVDRNIQEMEKSNLFVVPSRGEGFGTVYIEAVCSGLPVIGFAPAVKELNEMFGMQVGYEFDTEKQDSKDLAQLIDQAMNSELTDPEYRKKFMKKAREHFSFETFKEKYVRTYREINARFS